MECYLYEGERLVYEGEGWGIIVDDADGSRGFNACNAKVYATHQECTVDATDEILEDKRPYGEDCWWQGESPAKCKLCSEPVPDGIQALVVIAVWDR
jgi:hypothetical protein